MLEVSLAEEGLAGSGERRSPYCKGPPHAVHGATSGGTKPPAAACAALRKLHLPPEHYLRHLSTT